MERWIVIPKWDEFQHYKDRSPSWIKNYTRLLSDDAYLSLTYAQRGLLHGIWLIYASSNEAPTSTRTRHLLTTNKGESRHFQDNLEALNHAGFITLAASKPLAKPYQVASLEKRERRTPLPPTGETFCEDCQRDYRSVEDLDAHRFRIHSQDKPPIEEGS